MEVFCFPLGTSHLQWEAHGDWKTQGQDVLRPRVWELPWGDAAHCPAWNRGVLFLYARGSWGVESGCPLCTWVPGFGIGVSSVHVGPGVWNRGVLCL